MRIYKYPFALVDRFTLELPADARIVHVAIQPGPGEPYSSRSANGTACIWAIVSPEAPQVHRVFHIRGTGHEIGYGDHGRELTHVATFQDSPYVWHLFEEIAS